MTTNDATRSPYDFAATTFAGYDFGSPPDAANGERFAASERSFCEANPTQPGDPRAYLDRPLTALIGEVVPVFGEGDFPGDLIGALRRQGRGRVAAFFACTDPGERFLGVYRDAAAALTAVQVAVYG